MRVAYKGNLARFKIVVLQSDSIFIPLRSFEGLDTLSPEVLASYSSEMSVNHYLIDTGENLVLIDAGDRCEPSEINASLASLGYTPEDIDTILITHLHPDHVFGLSHQKKQHYPNAKIYINRKEYTNRFSDDMFLKYGDLLKSMHLVLSPYLENDQIVLFDKQIPLPYLTVIPSPGHTLEHVCYLFERQGEGVLFWGDIIHSQVLQFENQNVHFSYDEDNSQSISTRKKLFELCCANQYWVGGTHFSVPGIGKITKENTKYQWNPLF